MFFTQTLIRGQSVKKVFWSDLHSFYIVIKDRSIDTFNAKCESLSEQYVFGTIFDVAFHEDHLFVVSDSGHVSKLSYCVDSKRWKNEFNVSVSKPGFHSESPVSVVTNPGDGSFMVLFLEQVIQFWLYDSLANNTKKSGLISDLGLIYCASFVTHKSSSVSGMGPYILILSERPGLLDGYQVTLFNCFNQTRSKFFMPFDFGYPLFVSSTSDGLVHCLTDNVLFSFYPSFENLKSPRKLEFKRRNEAPSCFLTVKSDNGGYAFLYGTNQGYLYEINPFSTENSQNEAHLVQLKSIPKELFYFPGRLVVVFDSGPTKIFRYLPASNMLRSLNQEKNLIGQFGSFLPILDSCVLPATVQRVCDDEKLLLCNYEKENGSIKLFCKGIKFTETLTVDLSEASKSLRCVEKMMTFQDFDGGLCIALVGLDFTSVFHVNDDVGDAPDVFSNSSESTILFTNYNDCIFQFLKQSILIHDKSNNFHHEIKTQANLKIIKHLKEDNIFLLFDERSNVSLVRLYVKGTLDILCCKSVDLEVTSVGIVGNLVILGLLGPENSSIEIWEISEMKTLERLDSCSLGCFTGTNVVNDICVYDSSTIVVGLRNGELIVYDIGKNEGIKVSEISRFKVGVKSISLFTFNEAMVVNSDASWLLTRKFNVFYLLPISIPMADIMTVTHGDKGTSLIFMENFSTIHVGEIMIDFEWNYYRLETIYSVNMPKRLVYDPVNSILYLSRLEINEGGGSSGQIRKSYIRTISSILGDNGQQRPEKIPECENSKDTTAICLWNVGGNDGNPILVVGAGTPYAKVPRAKISFYHVIQRKDCEQSKLKLKKFFDLPSMENATSITCVKTFQGYLLASFSNILNLYRFNEESKTVELITSYVARYPINKFGCQGKRIVLGLQRDVIHLLEFKDNKFIVIASDDEIHNCADVKALNENLFVGIDRWGECFLTRLQQENNGGYRLKTLVTCQLGESPISIKVVCNWIRRFSDASWIVQSVDERETPEPPLTRYNDCKPISVAYISTLSGSVIRLMRVTQEIFNSLKALELTLSKHTLGRPLLGHSYFYYRGRYRVNHVDGDMVKQFISLSSDEKIKITSLMDGTHDPGFLVNVLIYLTSVI